MNNYISAEEAIYTIKAVTVSFFTVVPVLPIILLMNWQDSLIVCKMWRWFPLPSREMWKSQNHNTKTAFH